MDPISEPKEKKKTTAKNPQSSVYFWNPLSARFLPPHAVFYERSRIKPRFSLNLMLTLGCDCVTFFLFISASLLPFVYFLIAIFFWRQPVHLPSSQHVCPLFFYLIILFPQGVSYFLDSRLSPLLSYPQIGQFGS